MQIRWLLLTVLCVALLAVGQMLFKSAAEQWHIDGWSWTSLRGFFSPPLLAALALYAVATVLWVFVLRTVPLSLAFPVYALTFIIVPLMAYFVWDEPVTYNTLLGGVVIMLGVIICTR
jgi:drug/metabolite transporter (DMT)-like permease